MSAASEAALARFHAKIARLPREIVRRVQPIVVQQAQRIEDEVEAHAPERSGDLLNSVQITPPGGTTPAHSMRGARPLHDLEAAVSAGNSAVRYGHLVEHGHGGPKPAPAHPFFAPAIAIRRRAARSAISRAVRAAIREAW